MNFSENETLMPVYTFLPPTDDISVPRLVLALLFIACLTISLSGNVSQFVLQLYCRRFRDGSPVQKFIAALFVLNAFFPICLPPLILERLVKLWMFGPYSCNVYHGFLAFGRSILSWLLVLIAVYTLNFFVSSKMRLKFLPYLSIVFLIILFFTVVLPQSYAAQYSVTDMKNHKEGSFLLTIHLSTCSLPPPKPSFKMLQIGIELVLPLFVFILTIIKTYSVRSDNFVKCILLRLVIAAVIQFGCNLPDQIPGNWMRDVLVTPDTTLGEYYSILPFISSSTQWILLRDVSSRLAFVRAADIEVEFRRKAKNNPNSSTSQRQLLTSLPHSR